VKKLRIPENLTTMAYKAIRTYILEGGLTKEGRLTEEALARKLGISKSPIREALTKLESEGLIRIEPRRGAYLRELTIKEIEDLYDLREALEAHVTVTANVTPELIQELRQSISRLQTLRLEHDKAGSIEEDIHFHNSLAQATGNALLRTTLEGVQRQIWVFRRQTYDLSGSLAVAAHDAIVDALEKSDLTGAERSMREHIAQVRRTLVTFLAQQADKVVTVRSGARAPGMRAASAD
jgi:DNA-binding GntR family transcriptional regulator